MEDSKSLNYDQLIARLDDQLQATKCKIWRKPQISPTREVALFATRISWSMVRVPVHLMIDYESKPTQSDFVTFFEESLDYSKRAFSGSNGPKVWISTFAIIPCLVCDVADPETIRFVSKRQNLWRLKMKHWLQGYGFNFYPVLYCLSTNKTYYWHGFDFAGAAVWPFARKFIEDTIVAATTKRIPDSTNPLLLGLEPNENEPQS
jgi:hypothetical protein